ncbi:MAG TPA: TfoX/Sxy family protein [Beijerinckiaceae bacterium]|nr:TfoX/Sxy family protein [Beijerinckiaceae bacterium]
MDSESIADLFAPLGPVRIRKMFGGQGVYRGELMFALEAYGELYLKADAETVPLFEAAGSRPFVYEKDGRTARMSYWLLPEPAADDPEEASRWGRLAVEAAARTAAGRVGRPRAGRRVRGARLA